MKVVEITPGLQISDATLEATLRLVERMGETTVKSDDQPGIIVSRISMPMVDGDRQDG